jgi:hypothetical protein
VKEKYTEKLVQRAYLELCFFPFDLLLSKLVWFVVALINVRVPIQLQIFLNLHPIF